MFTFENIVAACILIKRTKEEVNFYLKSGQITSDFVLRFALFPSTSRSFWKKKIIYRVTIEDSFKKSSKICCCFSLDKTA